jgi:murein L,D-transpeptidase YcbB/YkuD
MNLIASIDVNTTGDNRTKSFRKNMRSIPACLMCLMLTTLLSCGEDQRIKKYQEIVDHADRLKIYKETGAELILTREVSDQQELKTLKAILKQGIKPEHMQALFPREKIELYSGNTRQGAILIFHSDGSTHADFQSQDFELGLALTYRVGTYLNGLR